jgi:hypothetical protein
MKLNNLWIIDDSEISTLFMYESYTLSLSNTHVQQPQHKTGSYDVVKHKALYMSFPVSR